MFCCFQETKHNWKASITVTKAGHPVSVPLFYFFFVSENRHHPPIKHPPFSFSFPFLTFYFYFHFYLFHKIIIIIFDTCWRICPRVERDYLWSFETMEQLVNFIIRPPRYQIFHLPSLNFSFFCYFLSLLFLFDKNSRWVFAYAWFCSAANGLNLKFWFWVFFIRPNLTVRNSIVRNQSSVVLHRPTPPFGQEELEQTQVDSIFKISLHLD